MSSVIEKIVSEFKRKYESKYSMVIPDDWLSQCAEFISQEFPGNSMNEYTDLIFSQLLDFDLNEIGTESIKNNFFSSPNGTLNGCFFLQLKYCIDITESNFSHIQKLKGIMSENANVDADNVPTATQFERKDLKKNRMFTVYLTDGKNSITAIENRFIPDLKEDLLPGTKIEISGRIQYENHVLLLEPQNVKVLGGNVEDIASLDYMLHLIEEDIALKSQCRTNREKSKNFDTSSNPIRQSNNSKSTYNENPSQTSYKIEKQSQNFQSSYSRPTNLKNLKASNDSDDDDLLKNYDLNPFELKQAYNSKSSNSQNNKIKEEYPPAIKRPPSTESLSKNSNQNNYLKKQKTYEIAKQEPDVRIKNKNKMTSQVVLDDDEDDFLMNIDEKKLKSNKQFDIKSENKENISNESFDEFDQFIQNSPKYEAKNELSSGKLSTLNDSTFLNFCCQKNKTFDGTSSLSTCAHIVKGYFKQVINQLNQYKLKWYQEILVSDGQTELFCYIGDEPLSELLELTVKEAKELFRKAKESGDAQYNQIFDQKRKNCEQKLRKMTALMSFKYDHEKNKFCIFKIENIEYNRA